jgi:hypothetical protein
MQKKGLASLGNLLTGALARHGIGERVTAAQVVAYANELLPSLLATQQRGEITVLSYKQSELLVACKTPAARYVAEGLAKNLTRKLEERFPDQYIKHVQCVFRSSTANDDEWYNGATL